MGKFELTKTIDAIKLNPRTMRSLGPQTFNIPYGAILSNVTHERDRCRFSYLSEPYECAEADVAFGLRALE